MSRTTGSAPLSNASTSSRSRRRWFGATAKEWQRNTTSMLAARVWATARAPSNDARRTKADRRRSTWSTLAVRRRQHPVADGDVGTDVADAVRPDPVGRTSSELQPRSTRHTRAGEPIDPSASHAVCRSSPHPRPSRVAAATTATVTDGTMSRAAWNELARQRVRGVNCHSGNLLVDKKPTRQAVTSAA